MDLETRLAEARERLRSSFELTAGDYLLKQAGFDAAATIAREVDAEKDAEIAKKDDKIKSLQAYIRNTGEGWSEHLKRSSAEPRKVSDAQRKIDAVYKAHSAERGWREDSVERCNLCDRVYPCETVRIIESPADAEK